MFHVSAADHQRPTHARLHLRDARDAQIILEAVRLGILQIVTRRLNEAERTAYIKSGSVFVWEESDDELGLKRWTDGRFWSQSRMREPFLFYEERVVDRVPNEPRGSAARDSFRIVSPAGSPPGTPSASSSSSSRPTQGLVKQTYSAFVHGQPPGPNGQPGKPRKLHLTAYLTYADVANLPTVDMDPVLRVLAIPAGVYRSAKARSRQVDIENTYASAPPSSSQQHQRNNEVSSPTQAAPQPPAMSPAHYASQFAQSAPPTPSPYAHASMQHYGAPSPTAASPRYAYTPAPQSYSLPGGLPPTQHLPPHPAAVAAAGGYYGASASAYAGYGGAAAGYGHGHGLGGRDGRQEEDQRIISMLNARHVV